MIGADAPLSATGIDPPGADAETLPTAPGIVTFADPATATTDTADEAPLTDAGILPATAVTVTLAAAPPIFTVGAGPGTDAAETLAVPGSDT